MYKLHGTCDGILLMSVVSQLVAYNPFTRHWGRLPPLHDITVDGSSGSGVLAFYASDDSPRGQSIRELRILYLAKDGYHVHILGGQDYRLVQPFAPGMPPAECNPGGAAYMRSPVKHGDCLYWFPILSLSTKKYMLVLFDTKSEKFSRIATPFEDIQHDLWTPIQLLNFQEGLTMATVPVATSWTDAPIQLWVLNDNDGKSWSHKYTIAQPMSSLVSGADNYDDQTIPPMFLLSEAQGILLPCPQVLVHCDRNWSVLRRYTRAGHWIIGLSHDIEESFELHSYLDHNAEEPPFVFLLPTDSEEGTGNISEDDDDSDSESGGDGYDDSDNESGSNGYDDDDDNSDDSSGGEDEYQDSNTEDEDGGEDVQSTSEDSYSDDEDQPPAKRQK